MLGCKSKFFSFGNIEICMWWNMETQCNWKVLGVFIRYYLHGSLQVREWPRNLDFTLARKQANSRSTTMCAGPRDISPCLLSFPIHCFSSLLLWPPHASGFWSLDLPRRAAERPSWLVAERPSGDGDLHPSLPPSLSSDGGADGGPTSQAGGAVVFSGDGGLPGLPGPLTFPERRPLISAVAERPTPRRIPQRAAGRQCGRPGPALCFLGPGAKPKSEAPNWYRYPTRSVVKVNFDVYKIKF